ncbi:MAG: hypothetical protein SFX73_12515 [Kofleriaceae bacterium]|nr:hypothetical protein [Kofleriaceae bacterium]
MTERGGVAEWKLRAGAVPVAVGLALAFHGCETGHLAQRSALSMPLHELGHALTAWWCGFSAIPTLWKTLIPESRGIVLPAAVAALNGFLLWRGWVSGKNAVFAFGAVLGVLQFFAYTSTTETAHMAITFGGDAGGMILGTGLMLLFFVPESSKLREHHLRYGFLGIGAAGLVDCFATWWSARSNLAAIPFGEIEGVGLSDPSKLVEDHGWTEAQIVDRYVKVGTACTLVLVVVWLWATWSARKRAELT